MGQKEKTLAISIVSRRDAGARLHGDRR